MLYLKKGSVQEIIDSTNGVTTMKVLAGTNLRTALNYDKLTGPVAIGDQVVINTVAVDLGLGSGGFDFVYFNENNINKKVNLKGHIIKQRYTPWQFAVLNAEEQDSPYHELFRQNLNISGMPVAVATLHSQLPSFCLTFKELKPKAKLAYIMTDGAALPLQLSKIVNKLVKDKVIDCTVTYGQAFGGGIEAVNVFTALLCAKHICSADAVVVSMGPGITGTGTNLGFTAMEQGQILNAVSALEGVPVAVPRISFADKRERHRGISHHTIAALTTGCQVNVKVALPELEIEGKRLLEKQMAESGLKERHEIEFFDGSLTLDYLKKYMPNITTMGRTIEQDKEFFMAAGAAAYKVAKYL